MAVEKSDKENLRYCEILRNSKVKLKPCPFCGEDVNNYPLLITIQPLHSDEYLLAKLNKGHFLGHANGYTVTCPHCGARGSSDTCVIFAVNKWNNRHKRRQPSDDIYQGYHISDEDMRRIATTEKPVCCGKCGITSEGNKLWKS